MGPGHTSAVRSSETPQALLLTDPCPPVLATLLPIAPLPTSGLFGRLSLHSTKEAAHAPVAVASRSPLYYGQPQGKPFLQYGQPQGKPLSYGQSNGTAFVYSTGVCPT